MGLRACIAWWFVMRPCCCLHVCAGKDPATSECKIADFGLVACIQPKSRGSHRTGLDSVGGAGGERTSPLGPVARTPSMFAFTRMLSRAPTKKNLDA